MFVPERSHEYENHAMMQQLTTAIHVRANAFTRSLPVMREFVGGGPFRFSSQLLVALPHGCVVQNSPDVFVGIYNASTVAQSVRFCVADCNLNIACVAPGTMTYPYGNSYLHMSRAFDTYASVWLTNDALTFDQLYAIYASVQETNSSLAHFFRGFANHRFVYADRECASLNGHFRVQYDPGTMRTLHRELPGRPSIQAEMPTQYDYDRMRRPFKRELVRWVMRPANVHNLAQLGLIN
jgi:hypothetical protein